MILDYKDMELQLIWHTPQPMRIIKLACDITMKNAPQIPEFEAPVRLLEYVINAEHTKMLEHICGSVLVRNVSRSLLQQLITHRTWSATSASQHYQNYSDMPMIIDVTAWTRTRNIEDFEHLMELYDVAILKGMKKEEARQILPNASAVNILITFNYRCLLNFFSLRLCYRNVQEMRIFANRLLRLLETNFPEFCTLVGPQCCQPGGCQQGPMRCNKAQWTRGLV